MATIKDVAALAGISYTTVSHVLNKTRPVSEPVRLKVEEAIARLDYVPSAVARSLKAKSTATIGLLVANSLNPYFAELARGIEDYCERNNYCVILCNCDDDPDKQRSYLRVLLEKRVDGLVVASAGGDAGLASGLAGVRTPMVIVDRGLEGVDADLVAQIESGHVSGAMLDVFREEPLPENHLFWNQPRIILTPHTSARTLAADSIAQIVGKVAAMSRGEPVTGRVDLKKGY